MKTSNHRDAAPHPYVGVDWHVDDLQDQIESAVADHARDASAAPHRIHAVIDGAMNEPLGRELLVRSRVPASDVRAVYDATPLASADECGIFVWNLHHEDLAPLLARCDGQPMLSFIQSPLGVDDVALHLASFTCGQTPDGLRLALRIADPIALHDLVLALGAEAQDHLRAGFAAWHLIARDGHLRTWSGRATDSAISYRRSTPWPMSDAAFVQLVHHAEADEILCMNGVANASPWYPGRSTELHERIQRLLELLDRHGIQDAGIRRQMVLDAMRMQDDATAIHEIREQITRSMK
ncbi:MAG: DUF4123 domain-containing protein [Burkholderiales bacterium]|nr:DUF4123 domain-containing protein [Burkholderiales bacterium]